MAAFLSTIQLRPEHGYVVASAVTTCLIPFWAASYVSKLRMEYSIDYPTMYAPEGHKNAKEFNCAQRAHQNVLENLTGSLVFLFLAGVHRPSAAAVCGLIRALGFIAYVRGYNTGNPQRRMDGVFGYIGLFANLGMSIELAYKLIASA